jgi:hypothetical protein
MRGILIIFFLCVSFITFGQPPTEEVLTNDIIIQLSKAGLDKDVIKSKINTSKCNFTTTTADLMNLSKNKVPNDVINLMIKKENNIKTNPATVAIDVTKFNDLKYGIYILDTATNKYTELNPTVVLDKNSMDFEHKVKSGFGSLFGSKDYISINGLESPQKFYNYRPSFVFVFDTSITTRVTGNNGWENLHSPNDFFLLKMYTTKKNREFTLGKNSKVGTEIALDDKMKIPFSTRKIRNGVYAVYPTDPILKGEYTFLFVSAFKFIGSNRKLYDFSVR